ncbi:hypothetical protein [Roseobacter sp. CCS2]|uniref:hypothetical protein n=1 Tax=Roseobacter sp. CCS2 TaxID=391593 RepID=UPI0000F3E05E|nr:hypothetical protein [Roseobacter sp. CCS2]EBA12797.1 hypothetical protein RCCS2_15909 [Roseobacter sp. CCS2]
MPIIILILGALGGALYWWIRQNPRDAVHVAQDAVTTARNAPRKLAFRRQHNAHPVEGIDDPNIAICALAQAFLELDDLPTLDQRKQLTVLLRAKMRLSAKDTEEMEVLGRWLVGQCQTPDAAVSRLSRRLYKINGDVSWDLLQDVLTGLVSDELSHAQIDAISDIKRALHIR